MGGHRLRVLHCAGKGGCRTRHQRAAGSPPDGTGLPVAHLPKRSAVTVILPGWRYLLAFAGIGCAGALGYCGDWAVVVVAAAVVLVVAVVWVLRQFAATREIMRGTAGRHRGRRGLGKAVAYWATRAAQVPLP